MAPRWYALALLLPLGGLTEARVLNLWLAGPTVANPALRGTALGLFILLSLLANP